MTVYIDRLFAVNLALDYLLLLSTAQLMGLPLRRWRLGLAALPGAVYAVAAVCLPGWEHPVCKLVCGLVMAAVAFWGVACFWRAALLFGLLSGTLAGLMMAVGLSGGLGVYYFRVGWGVMLLAAAVFYGILTWGFPQFARHGRGELMEAVIEVWGRRSRIRVLHDTGNTLRNPVDGTPVLIVESAALRDLWPSEVAEIIAQKVTPEETMARLCRLGYTCFTLLPYQSIGRHSGLLLALRSDRIKVGDTVWPRGLAALYDGGIGGGAYHGLWGGACHELVAETAGMDRAQQAG